MKTGKNDKSNQFLQAREKALRATILANQILGKQPDPYVLSEFEKLEEGEKENSHPRGPWYRAGLFLLLVTLAYAIFCFCRLN